MDGAVENGLYDQNVEKGSVKSAEIDKEQAEIGKGDRRIDDVVEIFCEYGENQSRASLKWRGKLIWLKPDLSERR
jgi:hypothetical protein